RILAEASISIDAMLQKEAGEGETQTDLIILTHETQEKHIDRAIAAIDQLDTILGKVHRIRLEHLG
ncbi:MAG: homoserine dehydrogenase, partial [Burkholderiaceae bacterium]